ncbi:hypothetical protein [Candidatus Magnetominusculus dajiuhuensis]|uniref:hypothetical protein n=1 Tax=Candidatus Magnetominusculus dajiuhuensis TaxID=3137712 RepID=UPI003B43B0F7
MPTTLPIEMYDLLEKKVGKEDAREVGKLILASFDSIDKRAETVVIQKKAEIKEELTKELATKEDLAKLEGRLNEKVAAVEGRLNEKIAAVKEDLAKLEGRLNEKINAVEGRLNERITAVEGRLNERFTAMDWKMRVYFLILLFVMLLNNPKVLDLVAKLFGVAIK